jgi:hypothetical protein
MIDLSTASILIALLFIGFGEWMVVAWFSRKARGGAARKYPHWLPGALLTMCGIVLLALAAGPAFMSGNIPEVALFWVAVGLIAELPVILVWTWYWPHGIEWGRERRTPNPPAPFIVSGFVGGLIAAGIIALAVVVVPRVIH